MAKAKWDADKVIKRILALDDLGQDLTCSNVKEIDSALVGAAISYFGNWGSALEAAGLDYAEIPQNLPTSAARKRSASGPRTRFSKKSAKWPRSRTT